MGERCQFCGAAMEGGDGNPQTCASCRHETLKAPKPRLYVLTHEIIELEDYEEVPDEGTQIEIVPTVRHSDACKIRNIARPSSCDAECTQSDGG